MTDPTPSNPIPPQQPQQPHQGHQAPQQPQYPTDPQFAQGVPGQPIPGQPYPGAPGHFQAPTLAQVEKEGKGVFAGLFDLKFVNLIGLKVIPVLYVISLVLMTISAVIAAIGFLITGFNGGGLDILIGLVLALIIVPLFWLVYVILTRVLYELFISVFQINDNSRKIADNTAK